jgi:two-component system, LuxR family, sensor kinase FixL
VERSLLPVIDADPVQMHQLFQNLIGNAIKFRKDGVTPEVKVTVRSSENHSENLGCSEWIDIIVSDNGIGFSEKHKDKIFEIFQRLEGRKYEGSGIGLSICRKIAQRHGGGIQVKSNENEGTCFTVTLPVSQYRKE